MQEEKGKHVIGAAMQSRLFKIDEPSGHKSRPFRLMTRYAKIINAEANKKVTESIKPPADYAWVLLLYICGESIQLLGLLLRIILLLVQSGDNNQASDASIPLERPQLTLRPYVMPPEPSCRLL